MQQRTTDEKLNPFPRYRFMRETNPVYFDPQYHFWQVSRYDDVARVLSEYTSFSSEMGSARFSLNFEGDQGGEDSAGDQGDDPMSSSMFNMDPPRHRQLRNLVTQAFTPRSIAQLSGRITTITNTLLDQVAATEHMDGIDDLAYPLPVIVIAEMLGIPQEDREQFKLWSDAVVGASESGNGNPQAEMSNYFLDMIQQRNRERKDDLISALLDAQINGQHLNQREFLGFCILLLVAGNETTTNLIGNALLCFDEHPEVMEQLRAEPELLPGAIEEVLRYRSPVQFMYRRVVADVTLRGSHLRANQMVLALIGSANHDEAQFSNPESFDIRRAPNRHIAFGQGTHFCLGAPLARLEAKIALTLLLERFDDIQRVRSVPLEATGADFAYGVKHLPITFRERVKSRGV
jgi:cytochrome P450